MLSQLGSNEYPEHQKAKRIWSITSCHCVLEKSKDLFL